MLYESLLKKHFNKKLQTESLTHLQVLLREIFKTHIYFLESTNHTHHHYLPNPNHPQIDFGFLSAISLAAPN